MRAKGEETSFCSLSASTARVMAPTPQYAWPKLRKRAGSTVWVKHENHTPTGAFKVRGGVVYMDRVARSQPKIAGVVSATRGNHGQSISFSAARAGIPAPSSSVSEASNNLSAAPNPSIALFVRNAPIPGVNVNAIHANRPCCFDSVVIKLCWTIPDASPF